MTFFHPQMLASGDANVFELFRNADTLGKAIVVFLIIASLVAWTVIIGKGLDLKRLRLLNVAFERRIKQGESLLSMRLRDAGALGPYAVVVREAQKAAAQAPVGDGPDVRMRFIENAMQRVLADQSILYESKMVLLSSAVSGAPFLGLFGTVWGVMIAFSGMGSSSGATIQSLAPGVASALLATAAALVVAIPSVFFYNFLLTRTKIMTAELENFASWTADSIELELDMMEKGKSPSAAAHEAASQAAAPAPAYVPPPVSAPAYVPPPVPEPPPLVQAPPPPPAPTQPSPWAKPSRQYSIRLDEEDED